MNSRSHTLRELLADCFTSQDIYLAIVLEVLQSIRQAEIAQMLSRIYSAPGGTEALDVLMKYMYASLPSRQNNGTQQAI